MKVKDLATKNCLIIDILWFKFTSWMKGTLNGYIWAKYGCYPLRPCNFQNWPLRPLSATLCPSLQKLKLLCRNSINYAKPNICGWALMPKSMPSRLEPKPSLKIRTERLWLKKYFFRNKTFLFFKIESWNFHHLFEKKIMKPHKISTQSDNR